MTARWRGEAVRSSGRSVSYMPPGERKSGIPADTETPAPLSTTTRAFCRAIAADVEQGMMLLG